MESDFEGLKMQKLNIPTDIMMFTPGVMIIKMSKMAHFLYFLLITGKNNSEFGENIYVHFSENAMEYWVLSYH